MADTRLIEALARAIAANAEMIARNPNDWPDSLASRAGNIRRDLMQLENVIRDADQSGGAR